MTARIHWPAWHPEARPPETAEVLWIDAGRNEACVETALDAYSKLYWILPLDAVEITSGHAR